MKHKARNMMRKYLIIVLSLFTFNAYANDIESELGANNPYVNTKTMQAARYFCHSFFGLATKVAQTDSVKVKNLAHKVARLSSHCAKGNFHQALTESGLADAVHLEPSHSFSGAHHINGSLFNLHRMGGPGTTTPSSRPVVHRLFNQWEHRAIVLDHMGNPK
jgi:hypothetical protein